MAEPKKETSLATIHWLVEAGAEEAVGEKPIDRFAGPKSAPASGKVPMHPEVRKKETAGSIAASAKEVSLSTAPGAARALAASCTTLSALKSAVESFDGCELKRSATNTVFADGNPEGRIMFIGEAPGRDEDREGLPFVGRAGKLLDKMLDAVGLDRSKVYITNILPWRPPQNRDPTPEEAATCLPFLHRHIELAHPDILVLLGAVSARHLLGTTEGIMRTRGRWHLYQTEKCAIPAMPTLHPAYLLRQPSAKRLVWRDLLAIIEKLDELEKA